jgi:hypothetical protein
MINTGRVLLGGLVAGVVLNAGDFLIHGVLLTEDLDLMRQRLGLNPAMLSSTATMVTWTVVDFLLGILMVWTYAGLRPRFGAGPKTALLAALVPYLAVTLVSFGYVQMGIFAQNTFMKEGVLWGANMCAASLAGAWLYRE